MAQVLLFTFMQMYERSFSNLLHWSHTINLSDLTRDPLSPSRSSQFRVRSIQDPFRIWDHSGSRSKIRTDQDQSILRLNTCMGVGSQVQLSCTQDPPSQNHHLSLLETNQIQDLLIWPLYTATQLAASCTSPHFTSPIWSRSSDPNSFNPLNLLLSFCTFYLS